MALTEKQRRWLRSGVANEAIANAIADQIDSGGNPVAANVAAIPASTDLSLSAPAAASVTPDSPVATDLDAAYNELQLEGAFDSKADQTALSNAVNAIETALDAKADQSAVSSMMSTAESRLDALEAKVNAVIAALKAAGLMSNS